MLDGGLNGSERERAELCGVVRANLAGTMQKNDERKAEVRGDRWAEESIGQNLFTGGEGVLDELLAEGVRVEGSRCRGGGRDVLFRGPGHGGRMGYASGVLSG